MHGNGEQDLLDRAGAAFLADLDRSVRHPLEYLEGMPLRAAVFVDRHPDRSLND